MGDGRSITDLVRDIVYNVQDIVRSEARLAKTEMWEEARKAKAAGIFFGVGSLAAIFALLFLLQTAFLALALILPGWAAALVVGLVLGVIAALVLTVAVNRFKQIHPTPERTVETIKENVQWVKQQTK